MIDKIAVIGSNSFSGSSFINFGLSNGYEIIGFSRSEEPNPVFLPYKSNDRLNHFQFYRADINKDINKIINVLKEFKTTSVINYSSQSMVTQSWDNPVHWFKTNVVSTIKLHDELRKLDFLNKYIHISTPEVYGSCKGLVKESTNYNPSTPYAVSRASADMSLMTFLKNYSFPVVFTRAANVYGSGQQLYRIIPRTILYFLLGKKLQLHGGGYSVRSFIYINDVSNGTMRVIEKGIPGDIFHFSTDKNISIRELVKMIADQIGVSFEDCVEPVGERAGKDASYLLDSSKAKKELNWECKVSLEQGIEDSIKWVKDNYDILINQPLEYIHKV